MGHVTHRLATRCLWSSVLEPKKWVHKYMNESRRTYVAYMSSSCHISISDMQHSDACDMTCSYMRHDSFLYIRLISLYECFMSNIDCIMPHIWVFHVTYRLATRFFMHKNLNRCFFPSCEFLQPVAKFARSVTRHCRYTNIIERQHERGEWQRDILHTSCTRQREFLHAKGAATPVTFQLLNI